MRARRYRSNQIGSFVFHDEDADGLQDPGEVGVAGVEVKLSDGVGDLASTTTDGDGMYSFVALEPADVFVTFVPHPEFEFTVANVGGDERCATRQRLPEDIGQTLRPTGQHDRIGRPIPIAQLPLIDRPHELNAAVQLA